MNPSTDNRRVAERLAEAAGLLKSQGASPHRASAYRLASEAIAHERRDVRALFAAGGVKALDGIPHVGLGIASAIGEILVTGRWAMLERLRGDADPERLFRAVPGVGPTLAWRLVETLDEDTLEGLAAAARDGRLEKVRGVGPRRAAALRAAVDEMVMPLRRGPAPGEPDLPPVDLLLEIDGDYRLRAEAHALRTVTPRRFNPERQAWLPVMHTQRGHWHFTALYSNTALAHRMGRVHDWVVIYWYDGDHVERQCTVVTEYRGPLAGRRVVRGREEECGLHYRRAAPEGKAA